MVATWLQRHWQQTDAVSIALLPLSWVYRLLVALRHGAYRVGIKSSCRLDVPVIVVGNITVGGTGKTPLVIWLAELLRTRGYMPGIVSRGYRGRSATWPQFVDGHSDPALVGDEPVMIARRTSCPVMVDPNRVRAARALLERGGCDVIVADDGLQHLALYRDIEIAVIDGERRFGNEFCLPAGPLREPVSRLSSVAIKVTNGSPQGKELAMELVATGFRQLTDAGTIKGPKHFAGEAVHAVAGIGNPERFFSQLRQLGVKIQPHVFPDHHRFRPEDLGIAGKDPIVITEKDAVKCEAFASARHWFLEVEVCPDPKLGDCVLTLLDERSKHFAVPAETVS
ncbi:MAG: tetraacyldisaccharide 4'-kinase [Gammaproteobacteria bacterium]|nr:tetraacyldisaccharide 4'-kinase [Gammaproteobacteria bacterium]